MTPTTPRKNIYLIGYRGTGKSTTARLLAEALGMTWLDADEELEKRCERSIRTIFAEEGEASFRLRESALLEELSVRTGVVLATGGGVVLRAENRERLRTTGRVIWLTADVDTICRRLENDPSTAARRPALRAELDARREIEELLRVREPLYRTCADGVVETSGRNPEEVLRVLLPLVIE